MTTVIHTRVVTSTGGGPDKTILNSPRFLNHYGIRSFAVYLHPPGDTGFYILKKRAEEANCELIGIPDKGFFDWKVVWTLFKICKRKNVDIWHGHDYKTNVLGLIIRLGHKMKLITTVHGWGVKGRKTPFYYWLDRLSLRFYEYSVCVSHSLKQICLDSGVGKNKLVVIQNAIDTDYYQRRLPAKRARKKDLKDSERKIIIGSVGRLSKEKCFPELVDTVQNLILEDWPLELWIAGDGPEKTSILKAIGKTGNADDFKLLGFVEDNRGFLEKLDIFVLFSASEGLPNVVLESMAMEVPTIATSVGGVPGIIEDGISGLLCSPHDTGGLQGCLHRLLSQKTEMKSMALRGRNRIIEKYDFSKRMEKMVNLYHIMLDPQSKKG